MAIVTYVYDGPQRITDGSQSFEVADANGVRREVPIGGIVDLDEDIAATLEWLARLRPTTEPGIEGEPVRSRVEMAGTPSQDDVLAWEESLNAFEPKQFDRVQYMGTWDNVFNEPELQDGVGVTGQYFYVLFSITVDLGSGPIAWKTGDLAVYNEGIWEKVAGFSTNQHVQSLGDTATITPTVGTREVGILATLSQATLIANPIGTSWDAQQFTFRIKSSVSRALTWGTQYRGSLDVPLPTATSGGNLTDYFTFWYNATDNKFDIVGMSRGY